MTSCCRVRRLHVGRRHQLRADVRPLPPPRRPADDAHRDRVDLRRRRQTALGVGHFITTRQDYFDADGERVGSMLFRILKFRPAATDRSDAEPTSRAAAAAPVAHARPAVLVRRLARRQAADPALLAGAARCATRRDRCARSAARSTGTRSRPPAAARSTASSSRTTRRSRLRLSATRSCSSSSTRACASSPTPIDTARESARIGARVAARRFRPATTSCRCRSSVVDRWCDMNFDLTEEQIVVRDLAAADLRRPRDRRAGEGGRAQPRRLRPRAVGRARRAPTCSGCACPNDDGGSGFGLVELCLMLEEQGRHVAPVPLLRDGRARRAADRRVRHAEQRDALLPGVVAGDDRAHGRARRGRCRRRAATRPSPRRATGDGWQLDGLKPAVPAAQLATRDPRAGAPDDGAIGVFLVDPTAAGVAVAAGRRRPSRQPHAHLQLDVDVAGADRLGGDAGDGADCSCSSCSSARSVGLVRDAARRVRRSDRADRRVHRSASSSASRCGTFQGVAQRAADAYIDTEAMRVTMLQAAWRLDARVCRRGGGARSPSGGPRGRAAGGAPLPAPARRHRRRHRLPDPPLLPVGQADRDDARRRQRAARPPRRADRRRGRRPG